MVPVDLSEILAAANKYDNNSAELKQRVEEIKAYAWVREFAEKLKVQFGLAVEAWIKENEVDATAIQCWIRLLEKPWLRSLCQHEYDERKTHPAPARRILREPFLCICSLWLSAGSTGSFGRLEQ